MLKWPTLLSLEEELDYGLNRAVEDEGILLYHPEKGFRPNLGGQQQFFNDVFGGFSADNRAQQSHRVISLSGGIGSGKSYCGAVYLCDRAIKFPDAKGVVIANSFPQLAQATLVTLYEVCFNYNIPIEPLRETPEESALSVINRHPSHLFLGPHRNYIYVLSATSFEGKKQTSRGLQARFAWFDEAAYASETSFNTLDGRIGRGPGRELRGGICITTTPRSYNWYYRRVADPTRSEEWKKTFYFVNCPTVENAEYLGEEYVTSLKGNYAGDIGRQELEGMFLDLTVGRVYKYFRRDQHCLFGDDAKILAHNPGIDLIAAFDFNYSPAVCCLMQFKAGEIHAFKEFFMLDSDVYELSEKVRDWIIKSKHQGRVLLDGDASGRARSAVSKVSAWDIVKDTLKGTGCEVVPMFPRANPRVGNRIDSVNYGFRNQAIFVDLDNCPELVKDFESLTWSGEDIDKSDSLRSHLSDSCGYSVYRIMPFGGRRRPEAGTRAVAGLT